MAWEYFCFVELFFLEGVMFTEVESKLFLLQRANAAASCKSSAGAPCLAFFETWEFGRLRFNSRALEVSFNFLQRLAFGFRQEPGRGHEIDYSEPGKSEKHRRVPILADGRQENRGNGGGNCLIQH